MMFWPSIHRVLGGASYDRATIDLQRKLAGRNIQHIRDRATGLSPDELVLTLEDGHVSYGTLVIALGSETVTPDIPGINEHALDVKQPDELERIRAAAETDHHVAVVGGGPTGVETAGFLNANQGADVTLVESDDRLLPRLPRKVGHLAERELSAAGVDVRTETQATRFRPDMIEVADDAAVPCDTAIWTGGVQPQPVINSFPLPREPDGIPVDDRMRVTGYDDIYAVGDIAAYPDKQNRAFFALKEAKTAVTDIVRRHRGRTPFIPQVNWEPTIVSLAPWNAIFALDRIAWSGRFPALMRSFGVEYRYMVTRKHVL